MTLEDEQSRGTNRLISSTSNPGVLSIHFTQLPKLTGGSRPADNGKPPRTLARHVKSGLEQDLTKRVSPRQSKRPKSALELDHVESRLFPAIMLPSLPKAIDMLLMKNDASGDEDDDLQAPHRIKKLLEEYSEVADPDDYITIGKLMEKLKLMKSSTVTAKRTGDMQSVELFEIPQTSESKKRMFIAPSPGLPAD